VENFYQPSLPDAWEGRRDTSLRFHQVVNTVDLREDVPVSRDQPAIAFLGFASDEGIRRNQGRVGAVEGPHAIRKALSNFPLHGGATDYRFFDAGNVVCYQRDLEQAQHVLGEMVSRLLSKNMFPILLGGGHEMAWGHFQGLAKAKLSNCAIVNFDAHFDLRPVTDQGNSGTAMGQIAKLLQSQGLPFSYTCFGIQKMGNTPSLFEEAKRLHVNTIFAETFHLEKREHFPKILDSVKEHDRVYLTICLDVFAAPYAPGVSAPQPLGLLPWHCFPLLRDLAASGKVVSMDIAELSPPHDVGGRTAALAAALIAEFICFTKS